MTKLVAVRRYPDKDGRLWLGDGEYGQRPDGVWNVRPPGCHVGELTDHIVTEHDDGTVTVEPSIRSEWGDTHQELRIYGSGVSVGPKRPMYWHGYLIRGEWWEI